MAPEELRGVEARQLCGLVTTCLEAEKYITGN